MKLPTLQHIHVQVNIERIPSLSVYTAFTLAVLCLLAAGWFTYLKVYVPYVREEIPEEKFTQKQDKLNVKDFEDVRTKLKGKQEAVSGNAVVDPFQTPKS